MTSRAGDKTRVMPIWRDALGRFRIVWGQGIIVTSLFIAMGLGIGFIYGELTGTEVLVSEHGIEWAWDEFLFNWLGWVLHYLGYAVVLARLMARETTIADESPGVLRFLRSCLPLFMILALPSSVVSTWMPNATFSVRHALMMAPQSFLDVMLSVVGLRWAIGLWLRQSPAGMRPDWKELPFGVAAKLVLGLTFMLASAEMAYAGLGDIHWQVLTGSYNLAVAMRAVTWFAAFAALYLNLVVTPSLMVAWYRGLPCMKVQSVGIRKIFA